MITLSNGHKLEYVAASGALAYNGRGWWWEQILRIFGLFETRLFTAFTKTLTFTPERGNLRWYWAFGCIRFITGGVVNAVALTNPGYKWWCRHVGPTLDRRIQPVAVSITGNNLDQIKKMAIAVSRFDIVAIEFDADCPNADFSLDENTEFSIDACYAIKSVSDKPLILKVSNRQKYLTILKQTMGLLAAVSINGVRWMDIFKYRRSPLRHHGGGAVSGQAAQVVTWDMVRRISKLKIVPVIGPSVWDYGDLQRVRENGAQAISFGSVFLCFPWRPTLYVRRDKKRLKKDIVPMSKKTSDHR